MLCAQVQFIYKTTNSAAGTNLQARSLNEHNPHHRCKSQGVNILKGKKKFYAYIEQLTLTGPFIRAYHALIIYTVLSIKEERATCFSLRHSFSIFIGYSKQTDPCRQNTASELSVVLVHLYVLSFVVMQKRLFEPFILNREHTKQGHMKVKLSS